MLPLSLRLFCSLSMEYHDNSNVKDVQPLGGRSGWRRGLDRHNLAARRVGVNLLSSEPMSSSALSSNNNTVPVQRHKQRQAGMLWIKLVLILWCGFPRRLGPCGSLKKREKRVRNSTHLPPFTSHLQPPPFFYSLNNGVSSLDVHTHRKWEFIDSLEVREEIDGIWKK